MNLNHLAIFRAVAEAGGFTRGAEALDISQPAVSKQVGELEASLGARLFDRLPSGVRLTQAGELLLGYARRLFALERDAERALRELQGLERGRLVVGASTTVGAYLLPEVFARFRRLHPGVALRLEVANAQVIQQLLVEDKLDLAIIMGLVESEELEAELVREDDLVAIAPPGHPFLKRRCVTAAALCQEPFVMQEPGSGVRAVFERALAQAGLTVRPVMELGSTEAIKGGVVAGVGLAIVSRLTVRSELESGRLAVVPLADLSIRQPVHLVQLRGKDRSAAAREFLSLLGAVVG
jgi:DNA-binding transcriptional LysR family regulator